MMNIVSLNGLKRLALGGMTATLLSTAAFAETTLTFFTGNDQAMVTYSEALVAAFEEQNPDITVEIEYGPGGTERENMVKSRLATQTMSDVFVYNAGSLFQATNPNQTIMNLSGESFLDGVIESFQQVVTAPDGGVRGVPMGMSMAGGILYSKPIYAELGLEIPMTWEAFMANNAVIKDAGYAPVIQTFGDTWTSQLFILGDFFNVQAAEPDFAERYTGNEAKYATTEVALAGFTHQQDIFEAGYLNDDFDVATLDDGLRMVANAEGAHYPMLTFALGPIGQNYPDKLDDVGFFAVPGDDAGVNGTTVWMPNALYIAEGTLNADEAKLFLAFAASQESCQIQKDIAPVTGPFLIDGCDLPGDVPAGVSDMLPYFLEEGRTAPALEFLSPVKGPNLENIAVEIGSGFRTALDGAALYDEDVRKQAQQLGLEGW